MALSKTTSITVVGSINKDFVVRADHLPAPGESVVGTEFFQAFGGKGANQAVGISRLTDAKVHFVGAVGADDIGREALTSLHENGIQTEHVCVIDNVTSGVALIMLDAQGENCISAAPGANEFVDVDYVKSLPEEFFSGTSLMVVCQEIPLEAIEVVVARSAQFSVPILFNPAPPNPRLKHSQILQQVDFLTPNETEVTAITGVQIGSADDSESKILALKKLRDHGATSIAMTMGKAGCYVFDSKTMSSEQEAVQVPAPVVNALDTTAAGDSFNAALAVALSEGKDFVDACVWANQVAAISVTRKGAQPSLPYRQEI